jgi:hypothetical protein
MATAADSVERNPNDQPRRSRIHLTPTGLLMEGVYTHLTQTVDFLREILLVVNRECFDRLRDNRYIGPRRFRRVGSAGGYYSDLGSCAYGMQRGPVGGSRG